MLANISAIEARVGGGAGGVVFTRGSDTPDVGLVVDAGEIDDDGAVVEAAESMGSDGADTRLYGAWPCYVMRREESGGADSGAGGGEAP